LKTYFVRDIKHLFDIIFCDFNFYGPQLTAEITGYTVYHAFRYFIALTISKI
jgi:hypothetical protein